ncbi:MAG: AAA family ATPase [Clostridiales bacterium]|nr:AAA family ATPase [Clostridiales bacterium]
MAENENKEKFFLIVTLKKSGKATDPTEVIWDNKGELKYDFYELMKDLSEGKPLDSDDKKKFLVYLKIRTTGCWMNVANIFKKAVENKEKDCYIMARSKNKVSAVYKVGNTIEADKILNMDEEGKKDLLNSYKKIGNEDVTIDLKNISLAEKANADQKRVRFEVSDCGDINFIKKCCTSEYNTDAIRSYGFPVFKTEWDLESKCLDTAKAAEINITDLILRGTKQIVLTGAPGTGKTYLANKIAEKLARGITLEQLQEGSFNDKEAYSSDQIKLVQFHSSYDYSDFVEGLKPAAAPGGGVGFEVKDGTFRAFCKRAALNLEKRYIFIIDEINRADLSKVFGELIYGLEYRDKPFTTQYSQWRKEKTSADPNSPELKEEIKAFGTDGEFKIPQNVYIIGTMNDIDRSVETFDFALRRRFMWREIKATEGYNNSVIRAVVNNKDLCKKLCEFSKKVNENLKEIGKKYNIEITEGHKIGPAYFDPYYIYKDAKENKDNGEALEIISETIERDIWDLRIEPIIKEYARGYSNAEEFAEELRKAVFEKNGKQK